MKTPLQSRTIQAGATLLVTSVTSIILHYTGVVDLDASALGAAWSAVVSSALMIGLRFITKEPLGVTEAQDKAEETE
jgi:hypothetical protein